MTASARPAQLGDVVGAYRLKRLLGEGGMGRVYEGIHEQLGRQAAIKVLHPWLAADEGYIARLEREARIASAIAHPNIVEVFDFVKAPGRVACVMEFIPGPSLDRLLRTQPLLPLQALQVALQLTDAIRPVHAQGIVHRDIKPSNIAIVGDLQTDLSVRPSVKLLDFGIAKVATATGGRTLSTAAVGTPAYMAPEQLAAEPPSTAADVYGLCEVLYEMLVGAPMFEDESLQGLKAKLRAPGPPVDLRNRGIEFGAGRAMLEALLEAGLAVEPSERPLLSEMRPRLRRLIAAYRS